MAKFFLAATLLVVAALYSREANAYFCGFDDMNEWHRIAFTEHPGLADDFTTVPYLGYKYRPLSWTINRLTYQLGNASPVAFRTRNLVFHLLNVLLLYGIAMLLFRSEWVACTAALLFGIHPLANQSVVGGVWTVTPSDFALFLALFLFLLSMRRGSLLWLAGSLFVGWVGILAYDAVFFFFGLTFAYLGIQFLATRRLPARVTYLAALVLLTALFVGSYFNLRARYLPPGAPHPVSISDTIRNSVIYAGSFVLIVDPVLANEWFDTPVPSEALRGGMTPEWLMVTVLPAACLALFLLLRWRFLRDRLRTLQDWPQIAFLLVAILASFSPFLLFTDHASETYVYLPVAFFVLLLSKLLCQLTAPGQGKRPAYMAVMSVLVILSSCAVWVRNSRVVACGSTVHQVLRGLPADSLRQGPWRLLFASFPGEPISETYGMYGYHGIDSLGIGVYGAIGVQNGLQAFLHNPQLTAEVLTTDQFEALCRDSTLSSEKACFWVHSDGRVAQK